MKAKELASWLECQQDDLEVLIWCRKEEDYRPLEEGDLKLSKEEVLNEVD